MHHHTTVLLLALSLTLLFPVAPVRAHGANQPPHQAYRMGDLKLESGEVVKDFMISYVTHGTLNGKRNNAVLMVTALSGNHHRIDFLTAQPRMKFPKFTIRDMVHSQHRLLPEHLKVDHVVTVIGASMGGMQALQWGVSHPAFTDSVVGLVPLARTPAWTTAVLEMSRQLIMTDPAWNKGDYATPPEQGMRLWATFLGSLIVQSRAAVNTQFPNQADVPAWTRTLGDGWRRFDANDWIYQTWAYDAHNVATTPGVGGDLPKALRAIKAKTLIMAAREDLLNPEDEPFEAARHIRDARFVWINPPAVLGHRAAAAGVPAENDHINAEVGAFLDVVTERGRKLQ